MTSNPQGSEPTYRRLKFQKIKEVDKSKHPKWFQSLLLTGLVQADTRIYSMNQLRIFVSHLETHGWHLSVSHEKRYPTWDEIAHIRYELLPDDIYMAMLMPPMDKYINIHEHCFQLIQVQSPAPGIYYQYGVTK